MCQEQDEKEMMVRKRESPKWECVWEGNGGNGCLRFSRDIMDHCSNEIYTYSRTSACVIVM